MTERKLRQQVKDEGSRTTSEVVKTSLKSGEVRARKRVKKKVRARVVKIYKDPVK